MAAFSEARMAASSRDPASAASNADHRSTEAEATPPA